MKRNRDLLILLGLAATLILFLVLGPGQASNRDDSATFERPTTFSSDPRGTMALLRWLQRIGYDAEQLAYQDYTLTDDIGVVFLLRPTLPIDEDNSAELLQWVERGGTLIFAEDRRPFVRPANDILATLDIEIDEVDDDDLTLNNATIQQPFFSDPPVSQIHPRTEHVILPDRNDVAAIARARAPDQETEHLTVAGLPYGAGYIYIASGIHPFTNAGLADDTAAHGAMVLNMLRWLDANERVIFDEYHHGYFEPPSLRTVVFSNAWGWGLLYVGIILGGYVLLSGRRFGHAIPTQSEQLRRGGEDYVLSMADMFQRSGNRTAIQHHYYQSLRRKLARRYGINPQADDTAFQQELTRAVQMQGTSGNDPLAALRQLQQANTSEAQLIRALNEADQL